MARRKIQIALIVLGLAGLAIVFAWFVLYFGLYIGYGLYQTRGHQEFAKNGLAQIKPAWQMDQLFEDCRHYITYSGRNSVPTWNAVAFFGGRYELTMQVPVDIQSSTRGNVAGEPRFYLHEVDEVTISPSGQIGVSFSNSLEFGPEEWKTVYESGGDLASIGFPVSTGPPVKNFDEYARTAR